MLLTAKTIENVQKAINKSSYTVKEIKVKAIYTTPKISVALYILDGELVASQLYPFKGAKMSNLILDAAAFCDYYILEEIYRGLEKDDTAELIESLWPCNDKRNVVEISSLKENQISKESFNNLANKFNNNHQRRRK